MTPIISPWWFYLFNIVENIGCASFIITMILGLVGIIYALINETIKFNKMLVTIFIISGIFTIFTPTKETCYQMAAASLVTPDNLTAAGNAATDIIDYIVDSIDEILEEEEQ